MEKKQYKDRKQYITFENVLNVLCYCNKIKIYTVYITISEKKIDVFSDGT